ncbi:MAG: EAL domain-containing protein [Porticoccaceae bacterium]|nr:MAG: EAL domain-containing protein [Porticoccaceae bacterium]
MAGIGPTAVTRTAADEFWTGEDVDLPALILGEQQTGIAVLDSRRRVICWNRWMVDWTGVAAPQALNSCLDDLFPDLAASELLSALAQVAENGMAIGWSQYLDPERLDRVETAMTPGDRALPLFRLSMSPVPLPDGRGTLLEVVEAPFQPGFERLRGARTDMVGTAVYLDERHAGVIEVDACGRIQSVNSAFGAITGFVPELLIGAPARLVFPALGRRSGADVQARLLGEVNPRGRLQAVTATGDLRWLEVSPCTPIDSPDGLVLLCRDDTVRLAERRELQLKAELVAALFAQVADGALLMDQRGCIERVNAPGLELLGLDFDQTAGRRVDDLIGFVDAETDDTPVMVLQAALARGAALAMPAGTVLRRADGGSLQVVATLTPLRDQDNELVGGLLVFRACTEAPQVSQRLAWQAEHDALTGLSNRSALAKAIGQRLGQIRGGEPVAVLLYIDVANFSLVNDTCGHAAGDTLLQRVARLLERHIGPGEMLARIGNDEFALLLHRRDAAAGGAVAEAVLADFQAFSFPWGERRIKIGVNIGVEMIDSRSDSDIDVLVAAAASCAKAKDMGRNRMYFAVAGGRSGRGDGLDAWVPRISAALDENRFRLLFQPIIELRSDAEPGVRHCEALVRMVGAGGELISPQGFIPAAERYGLIEDIDRWVVAEAVRVLQGLPRAQRDGFKLSVNLSGATISDESSAAYILDLLNRSGVDPRRLQFEITETAAIRQFDRALSLIHRLRAHGCYFALDDFGSGLSSLRYLQEIPVDYLKIDGAFIRKMELSDVDFTMVSTINHLAHTMGIATIAESVENAQQLSMLRDLGVDCAQGFFIAMPQPLESILV